MRKAVTRAAWIRERGCNSILGLLGTGACGSVAYDVTRTPGREDSRFLYKLLSRETRGPRAPRRRVEAAGRSCSGGGHFYPEGGRGLSAAPFPVRPLPPGPASPSLPVRFPGLRSLIFP